MECRELDNSLNIEGILIRYTIQYLDKTHIPRDEFIKNQLIPELVRAGVEHDRPDAESQAYFWSSFSKKVERWLKGNVKTIDNKYILPWINSFPDEYRQIILQDICGIFGSFYHPLPAMSFTPISVQQMQSNLAEISERFGNMLSNSEGAMDGVFDEKDDPKKLQKYVNELFSLISTGFVELEAVVKGTGVVPSAYQAMNNILFTAREGQQ